MKESSYYNSLLLIGNWNLIKELKIENITNSLPEYFFIDGVKIEKNSKEYIFLENGRKNIVKKIKNSDFPKEIKEKWLNFYNYKNISLKKYEEFLEMLKGKPFYWNKNIFKFDKRKINNENLLDKLMEIHDEITNKMFLELKKQKSEN